MNRDVSLEFKGKEYLLHTASGSLVLSEEEAPAVYAAFRAMDKCSFSREPVRVLIEWGRDLGNGEAKP